MSLYLVLRKCIAIASCVLKEGLLLTFKRLFYVNVHTRNIGTVSRHILYSTGGIKCFGVDGIKMRDADNMRDADVDDDFNKL